MKVSLFSPGWQARDPAYDFYKQIKLWNLLHITRNSALLIDIINKILSQCSTNKQRNICYMSSLERKNGESERGNVKGNGKRQRDE